MTMQVQNTSTFVLPMCASGAGVKTAVALLSVPACPYAGQLLTSTEVNGVWCVQGFASVDPNPSRKLVLRVGFQKNLED
jgi:hypothetical protein